VVPACS